MPIVEKNDVDIKPLFAWSREFEVIFGEEERITKIYMRILGDADMNRARVASLRRSAEMRRKLKDLNSDERLAYIKDIDELETDTMVSTIIVLSMKEIGKLIEPRMKIKLPKQPRSDASTEEHEKYQAEVDSYPERRKEETAKLLEVEILARRDKLSQEPKESLYKMYIAKIIDEICEQEMLLAFREWCAYLGSYRNEELTERLFLSFEEFSNLSPDLKAQFIEEYASMELYGEELKKLRRVTR